MCLNTETCGTGRSTGCPPVPCGLRAVPGGSAPLPLPRADDHDCDWLQGSCWAPTVPRARDLQPRSLTRGHGCLSSPGRGPLRPWLCGVWSGPARVGRTLAGDPLGTQHLGPGAEPPAAFSASRMGGAALTLPQETGLCSCLCSRLVSSGQPREGRDHGRGAPLSAPRMGLPRCPRGIWAGVASGDCLSFQWFLAMFCLEG